MATQERVSADVFVERLVRGMGGTYSGIAIWDTADPKMFEHSREEYRAAAGGRDATVLVQVYLLPDGTPLYGMWSQEAFEDFRKRTGFECILYEGDRSPSAILVPVTDENDERLRVSAR